MASNRPQGFGLSRELAEKNSHITIPTFMAISSADATVDSDLARIFFCKITENVKNQMIWYTAKEKKDDPKKTCGGLLLSVLEILMQEYWITLTYLFLYIQIIFIMEEMENIKVV